MYPSSKHSTITLKGGVTLSDIYQTIRNQIITLELEPGDIISETDMSKKFNISRTPIREVFQRLEYDGLVNIIKNKGTEITPVNFKKILNFTYMREKIEVGLLEEQEEERQQ